MEDLYAEFFTKINGRLHRVVVGKHSVAFCARELADNSYHVKKEAKEHLIQIRPAFGLVFLSTQKPKQGLRWPQLDTRIMKRRCFAEKCMGRTNFFNNINNVT